MLRSALGVGGQVLAFFVGRFLSGRKKKRKERTERALRRAPFVPPALAVSDSRDTCRGLCLSGMKDIVSGCRVRVQSHCFDSVWDWNKDIHPLRQSRDEHQQTDPYARSWIPLAAEDCAGILVVRRQEPGNCFAVERFGKVIRMRQSKASPAMGPLPDRNELRGSFAVQGILLVLEQYLADASKRIPNAIRIHLAPQNYSLRFFPSSRLPSLPASALLRLNSVPMRGSLLARSRVSWYASTAH